MNYQSSADMFSLGCIIAELATGRPLFPSVDQNEHLTFMKMMLGNIPNQMIGRSRFKQKFFDHQRNLIASP